MDLNVVDTALRQIGISQYDMTGQMRNTYDVLDELGRKWHTLDATMQSYLATMIAGTKKLSWARVNFPNCGDLMINDYYTKLWQQCA